MIRKHFQCILIWFFDATMSANRNYGRVSKHESFPDIHRLKIRAFGLGIDFMSVILPAMTVISTVFIVWHFAIWPVLIKRLARSKDPVIVPTLTAELLPTLALIVPAHNEERWIAEKIANIATLDYPADRLRLVLALDGCSDQTRVRAEAALEAPEAAHLRAEIVESQVNVGKLETLNRHIREAEEDIIAVSDTSGILSLDGLVLAAAHFDDQKLGAVGGTYTIFHAGEGSEADFWSAQTAVKKAEAAFAAPIGLHGAFYAFRREFFVELRPDTINDDFTLPMGLIERGYDVAYDPTILAVEMEASSSQMDFSRRRRIGAGNMQQLLRHWRLFSPSRPSIAIAFASGKGLRPLIPLALIAALFGSLSLASGSWLFALGAAGQLAGYAAAGAVALLPNVPWPNAMRTLQYIVAAQFASGVGGVEYLMGRYRGAWARVDNSMRPARG